MKLPLRKLIDLKGAILALQNQIFSGKTTCYFAKNLQLLEEFGPKIDQKRNELLVKHGNPPAPQKGQPVDPKYIEFAEEYKEFVKEEIEINLQTIPYDSLRIGDSDKLNHIPAEIVADLMPILEIPEEWQETPELQEAQ